MTHPPLLSIHNLSVSLGEASILHELSLVLNPGDYVNLIGPNGAGKTTLLKTILGFIPHHTGEIQLGGKPLKSYPHRERARWIAYVPQLHDFDDFCTVHDFVAMGRYPYLGAFRNLSPADHGIAEQALEQTGIAHLAGRAINTLSGGEQQKALIASALAQQPKILALDEPATFLDPKNQQDIQQLLRAINRDTGTTILAITHDLNNALHDGSRVVGLRSGHLLFDGPPHAVMTEDNLHSLYDTDFVRLRQTGALSATMSDQDWLMPMPREER